MMPRSRLLIRAAPRTFPGQCRSTNTYAVRCQRRRRHVEPWHLAHDVARDVSWIWPAKRGR